MVYKLKKSSKIVLFLALVSFMTLTPSIVSAKTSGVDLVIQSIRFTKIAETNQTVNFAVVVKNRGTEATQSLSVGMDFGNGVGGGFAAPIVIESGETKVFGLGAVAYREAGKFVVRASVNAHPEDVNLRNNLKTAIIHIR